jgi:hypothetical protein
MHLHLLPEERLRILQTSDPRRRWHSLDDQRVCVLCSRTITGRQVSITRETTGKYSVRCPTDGCPAVPSDWFYQGSACSTPANETVRTSEASIWNA